MREVPESQNEIFEIYIKDELRKYLPENLVKEVKVGIGHGCTGYSSYDSIHIYLRNIQQHVDIDRDAWDGCIAFRVALNFFIEDVIEEFCESNLGETENKD